MAILAGLSTSACHDLFGTRQARAELLVTTGFSAGRGSIVAVDRAHVVVHDAKPAVALDTVLAFSTSRDADSLVVFARLDAGTTFSLTVALLDPTGAVAFHAAGGGIVPTHNAPAGPLAMGLVYVGPGAHATQVIILDTDHRILTGDTVTYRATAHDSLGAPVPEAPVAWHSLHPTRGIVVRPDSGRLLGGPDRGHARIAATLLTGPADTSTLFVQPLPALLVAELGSGQEGYGGQVLPFPLVGWVRGTDAQGVQGIWIHYVVTEGGGTLSDDSVLTNIDGRAPVRWTLGPTATTQTVRATTRYLPDQAVTFYATRLSTGG